MIYVLFFVLIALLVAFITYLAVKGYLRYPKKVIVCFYGLVFMIYLILGNYKAMYEYYTPLNLEKIENYKKFRPLHARLQQELVANLSKIVADPNNINAWWRLAKIYEIKGDFNLAVDAWDKLILLEPNNPEHVKAWLKANLQDNQGILSLKAIDVATTLHNTYLDDPSYLNILLLHEYNSGNYTQALAYLKDMQVLLNKYEVDPDTKIQVAGLAEIIAKKTNK